MQTAMALVQFREYEKINVEYKLPQLLATCIMEAFTQSQRHKLSVVPVVLVMAFRFLLLSMIVRMIFSF